MSAQVVEPFYAEFGRRIRVARLAAGLTQADLGERIGMTRASVANLEAGRQRSQVHLWVLLAATLGVEPVALLPEVPAEVLPGAAAAADLLGEFAYDDRAELVGPFRLYPPPDDPDQVPGWAVSWGGAWLPGRYADRDAALFACGYVLGGESRGDLEAIRDSVGGPIALADLAGLRGES